MARLAQSTRDIGEWGNITNEFLRVSHNEDGTLKTQAGLTLSDDLVFSADKVIRRDTSDGSDDGVLILAGGGASSNTRGARVEVFGNEYAGSDGGEVKIQAGNVSTGDIVLSTAATSRVVITYAGQVRLFATLYMAERAVALADISGSGQIWVKTGAPSTLAFTAENGLDFDVGVSSGTTGGTGSAGSGNQYIELNIGGTTYKILHDGTV